MRFLFIPALVLVLIMPVQAVEKTLSLQQAIDAALARNLNVVQAQNNVDAAQSGVLAAYGRYLPTISMNGGWGRSQSQGPLFFQGIAFGTVTQTTGNFSTSLNANYLLFDAFGREASFNRASANAVSAEQTSARTRQTIVFSVESSYLNVLRQEQLVKVSEENLKRDARQLERITESNKVGALSLADVYRQQSQVAADELNLINAQNAYDKAKADLVALIGLDVLTDYTFIDPTISTAVEQTEITATMEKYKNLSELTERALRARPDYLSTSEAFRATESGVTQARSDYFPSVSAYAGLRLNNERFRDLTQYKNYQWGISFNWNIFDGFQTNQAMQSAIASRRNAEIALVQAERNIAVDVKKAMLDLDAARKQLEVSQKGLRSATEDRKIAEERYNLGAGTLLDLLVANANYVNAAANTVNASYNYVIAKRNVEYALGERTY